MTKKIPALVKGILFVSVLYPAMAWAVEASVEGGGFFAWLHDVFKKGGPYLIINCFVLAWGVAVMIERVIFIFFRYNVNAEAFMAQIQKLVMANDIERAIKLCNAAPSAALPKVVKAGLTRANRGEVEIRNAVEEASLEIVPLLQKRTPNLAQIANLATLLGLLGTISGLINAFEAVGKVAAEFKSEYLAAGVSEAMLTTAWGLIIAVICMLGHLFLSNTTKKIIDEIDQYSVKLENLLISRGKGNISALDRMS